MPKRPRLPRAEIIEYNILKAAAAGGGSTGGGGGGSDGDEFYIGNDKFSFARHGDTVTCRVVALEPYGFYEVIILGENLIGRLTTDSICEVDQEIQAEFLCVYNDRIQLTRKTAA